MMKTFFCAIAVVASDSEGVNLETLESAISLLQHRSAFVGSGSLDISSEVRSPEDFCNSDFKLSAPVENTLDQVGGRMKFQGVTNDVDLIVSSVEGTYQPADAGQNGLKNGFGNINMKTGTNAIFEFKFVKTGTEAPVEIPKVSCSFYDMDEGKRGKGRGSISTCGAEASFIPSTTELSQVKGPGGCYKTTSCERGVRGNDPESPEKVGDDALTRTMTYSYTGKSSFTIKLESTKGHKGRNYMFSLDPIGACRVTTTTTTTVATVGPKCKMFQEPYDTCSMMYGSILRQDFRGVISRSFHIQGIHRAAISRDGNFELQVFHCAKNGEDTYSSTVCAIAVKIGENVITYSAKSHDLKDGKPVLQWKNGSVIGQGSTPIPGGAWAHIADPKIYPGGVTPPSYCYNRVVAFPNKDHQVGAILTKTSLDYGDSRIDDYNPAWILSFGYRKDVNNLEIGFRLGMFGGTPERHPRGHHEQLQDDTKIDERHTGSYCEDGADPSPALWNANPMRYDNNYSYIDFHDFGRNLFPVNMTDYICENMMAGHCAHIGDTAAGAGPAVDPGAVGAGAENTCKLNDISFSDAQAACQGYSNRKVTEGCQLQYCTDAGEGLGIQAIREAAEEGEAQIEASLSLDRDFTPNECCGKYTCDKTVAEF